MPFIKLDINSLAAELNAMRNEIDINKLTFVLNNKLDLKIDNTKSNDKIKAAIDNIMRILKVEDKIYLKTCIQKNFSIEFNQQINNILEDHNGCIDLLIKNTDSKVTFVENNVFLVNNEVDTFSEAIYLDDPFILDNKPKSDFLPNIFTQTYYYGHKEKLVELIYSQTEKNNLVDKIVTEERLKKIIDKLHIACKGNVFFKNNNDLMYQQDNMKTAFKVANLSTGLKTFVILQTLLLSGAIKDGSLIILDEPEIHLHPEWQLLFAELIVMLQKEFNLHILLNTHSPYFLNAIEVFSEKYAIGDKCEYYLAYNKQDESYVKCVTGNVEDVYAKLARPLQRLENLRYADDE